ncbi:MAG: GAF domain-containing protein [Anaerolineae bacterium]|nr:GAF domain-containing protein [Anaerolineae bacterium]
MSTNVDPVDHNAVSPGSTRPGPSAASAHTILEQTAARKSQSLLMVTRFTFVAVVVLILFSFLASQLALDFPLLTVLPLLGVYVALVILVRWARARGAVEWASRIYLVTTGLIILTLSYFLGGPTGPMSLAFGPLIIIAALISGRGAALGSALGVLGLAGVWVALQSSGLLVPYPLTPVVGRLLTMGMLLICLGVTVALLAVFVGLTEAGLLAAHQRGEELAEALQSAELAARAESDARQQVLSTVEQLQQSVQEYTAFLGRVEEGDFDARLDMEAMANRVVSPALLALGARLNRTVETLVTTLTELRVVQQRYLQEAWTMFLEGGQGRRGFRASGGEVSTIQLALDPTDSTPTPWSPLMAEAAKLHRLGQRSTVVASGELALPIAVRDEVVGAISARRSDGNPWTAEELALLESVMDQLGQTLETLRLVEETQRQAQRQQVLGDLSVRFGRSFDVDALLQQAVVDLGRLLDLDEVMVFLEPSAPADSAVGSVGADLRVRPTEAPQGESYE